MSVQAKPEVVRRKHIVHLTGFGAYSSTCYELVQDNNNKKIKDPHYWSSLRGTHRRPVDSPTKDR